MIFLQQPKWRYFEGYAWMTCMKLEIMQSSTKCALFLSVLYLDIANCAKMTHMLLHMIFIIIHCINETDVVDVSRARSAIPVTNV